MRSDYRRVALIGKKNSGSGDWNTVRANRENAIILIIASILCCTATLVVASIFFSNTRSDDALRSSERRLGVNFTNLLETQSIQNGLIDGLELSLIEFQQQQLENGTLTFADANFTDLLFCNFRFGSSCSSPPRSVSQGYAAFESDRNGTIRISRLQSMNAVFTTVEIGNFSVPLEFQSGTPCDLIILPDPACFPSGNFYPLMGNTREYYSYRPNPIVYDCTGTPGCINPSDVLTRRIYHLMFNYVAFVFENVVILPPIAAVAPILDIKFILTIAFISII